MDDAGDEQPLEDPPEGPGLLNNAAQFMVPSLQRPYERDEQQVWVPVDADHVVDPASPDCDELYEVAYAVPQGWLRDEETWLGDLLVVGFEVDWPPTLVCDDRHSQVVELPEELFLPRVPGGRR